MQDEQRASRRGELRGRRVTDRPETSGQYP